jgi:hypothetical protein
MEVKADVKLTAQTAAPVRESVLPPGTPPITVQHVEAACKRSKLAKNARAEFEAALDNGRVFSRAEVKSLFERSAPKGKPDGNVAVVAAYYADNHGKIFSAEAKREVRAFCANVDWTSLMADLNNFIAELAEKEKAADRERALKKELLEGDRKVDDQKRALVKENGTVGDRKKERVQQAELKAQQKKDLSQASDRDLDDELTSSGRLPLSEKESTELKLRKRAFAARES